MRPKIGSGAVAADGKEQLNVSPGHRTMHATKGNNKLLQLQLKQQKFALYVRAELCSLISLVEV